MSNGPSFKELTKMINSVMGQDVLTAEQLEKIMEGAQKAGEREGMSGVLDYLMKVTQADVDKDQLVQFAEQIQEDPNMGMDILKGKKKLDM